MEYGKKNLYAGTQVCFEILKCFNKLRNLFQLSQKPERKGANEVIAQTRRTNQSGRRQVDMQLQALSQQAWEMASLSLSSFPLLGSLNSEIIIVKRNFDKHQVKLNYFHL